MPGGLLGLLKAVTTVEVSTSLDVVVESCFLHELTNTIKEIRINFILIFLEDTRNPELRMLGSQLHVKQLYNIVFKVGFHFIKIKFVTQFALQRRYIFIINPAGHNVFEIG